MYRWMVAMFILTATTPAVLAAQAQPDATEREVLALHREINEAMFRGDPEPLARAALENLVVVPPGGHLENKAQVIRGTQNFRIDSVEYSEREVHVQGSTAVVTAKLMLYGELHGIDPATGQRGVRIFRTGQPSRQLSVFVKEQGRWWLLAQTTVPIRMPQAASRRTANQAQADAAGSESTASVEQEVREALLAEQRAFAAGDLETVQTYFSDDPVPFVVDGCMRGDKEALPACGPMAANRSKRARRSTERHDVHVLGPNAAHTITHYAYEITRPDGVVASYPSRVTKIWRRQGDAWRIVHVHESTAQRLDP